MRAVRQITLELHAPQLMIPQDNVLIDVTYHARLSSFSMEVFSGDTRTNDLQGSMRSTAPELFRLDEPRTYASDVYAFSCLCLEVRDSFNVVADLVLT